MKYYSLNILIFLLFNAFVISQNVDPNIKFDEKVSSISAVEWLKSDNVDMHDLIYNYQPQIEYAGFELSVHIQP